VSSNWYLVTDVWDRNRIKFRPIISLMVEFTDAYFAMLAVHSLINYLSSDIFFVTATHYNYHVKIDYDNTTKLYKKYIYMVLQE
jgi:hypothetical protein